MSKKVFTVGQVAGLLRVSYHLVKKWFDAGQLRGYRIPGTRNRRIPADSLVRFCVENDMPVPDEVRSVVAVVVGLTPAEVVALARLVMIDVAACVFEAGAILPTSPAPWCVIDFGHLGVEQAVALAGAVLRLPSPPRLVAVLGDDGAGRDVCERLGFEAVIVRPFDVASLADRLV